MRWPFVLGIGLLSLLAIAGAVGGGVYYRSLNSPEFCRSCHLMEASYQSWRTGEHRRIRCQECHRPPLSQKMKGVRRWLRERPQTFPKDVNFHFDEQDCISCHQKEDPGWSQTVLTKDHALHVHGVKGVNVGCLECHTTGHQHHAHAAEGPLRCAGCHGPDARDNLKRCDGCHGAAVRMMAADVPMEVPRASSEHLGVPCLSCHLKEGDGSPFMHTFKPILREAAGGEVRGCQTCHTDSSPVELRNMIRASQARTQARLSRLLESWDGLAADERQRRDLKEADGILRLIAQDGSAGFHNEVLTLFLLEQVEVRLKNSGREGKQGG